MVSHVVLFPFPAQGHINCMLKLADLLSTSDLHITFLNTHHNHNRLSNFSSAFARLSLRPHFRFLSIPDGLPDDDPRSANALWDLDDSIRTRSGDHLRQLLTSCRQDGWPQITCVLVDSVMPFAIEPVEDLGIPAIIFRTASACSLWAYHCIPKLIETGELPFPDEPDMDEKIQGVAGMESFLRRRDLPSFCRETGDLANSRALQMVSRAVGNVNRARAIILNTCESMEGPVLHHIRSSVCPTIFAIGPLHQLLARAHQYSKEQQLSGNLWLEDRTCMAWLDTQPKGSVVYVSFGSFTVMAMDELLEFWHGFVNSGHPFLWVIRPDLVDGVESSTSTKVLFEKTIKLRVFIVEWAPQEEVLAHPAVGCFLTHSGWNSTLDSVVVGVPMICWPFFADQQINSRFVSEVWGIGLDMKDMTGREVVEIMVRRVMEGEQGKELKQSALVMAELAKRSVQEDGSSYLQFQSLLDYINSL
ncbi:LOW QUALITY PROTEIN: myricetin 3-O-rhamnoside 1,2-glucosyltransferase UGT709G2-like [Dioscorea cayenensis subsp. rotundata]|uniref:Glycosyltransferase n=1 Tax=Dioscorea cayennensis subsp. rotundata TaxID=55577 RepID=A0AB40CWJ5_DIOCR|nr:LOW QUALITY PROTEIN: myricetin 3-O-rhamnoside 1,2-glucosyltransferase UGT709G2-like [Dioscorea cayenensis subsp. rotundata]